MGSDHLTVRVNATATPAVWRLRRCGGRAAGPEALCDRCGELVEDSSGECGRLVEVSDE
jgi:hypothetical protein